MRKVAGDAAKEIERAIDDIEKHGGRFVHFYVAASGYQVQVVVEKKKG